MNDFCVGHAAQTDDSMKNELTIRARGVNHHLVGYFKLGEAMESLQLPSFQNLPLCVELLIQMSLLWKLKV